MRACKRGRCDGERHSQRKGAPYRARTPARTGNVGSRSLTHPGQTKPSRINSGSNRSPTSAPVAVAPTRHPAPQGYRAAHASRACPQ
jgi:hypothetical protein